MLSILHIFSLVLPTFIRRDSDFFLKTEESNLQIACTSSLPQFSTTSQKQSQNSNSAGLLNTFSKPPGYTTSNIGVSSPNLSPWLQTPMTNFPFVRSTHGHLKLTMSRTELVLLPLRLLPSLGFLSWFPWDHHVPRLSTPDAGLSHPRLPSPSLPPFSPILPAFVSLLSSSDVFLFSPSSSFLQSIPPPHCGPLLKHNSDHVTLLPKSLLVA